LVGFSVNSWNTNIFSTEIAINTTREMNAFSVFWDTNIFSTCVLIVTVFVFGTSFFLKSAFSATSRKILNTDRREGGRIRVFGLAVSVNFTLVGDARSSFTTHTLRTGIFFTNFRLAQAGFRTINNVTLVVQTNSFLTFGSKVFFNFFSFAFKIFCAFARFGWNVNTFFGCNITIISGTCNFVITVLSFANIFSIFIDTRTAFLSALQVTFDACILVR